MKKHFIASMLACLFALVPLLARADAYDMIMFQRSSTDTQTINYNVIPPSASQHGFMMYNGTNRVGEIWTYGTGFSLVSGALNVTPAWSAITSKPTTVGTFGCSDCATTTALAAKFDTPTGTTSQYVRGDGSLATLPTVATPSQSSATRSLNASFQISTTRASLVTYSVQITVTASIAGGQNGDVILEIASDSGFTSNVQTVSITGLGQTYTLAVALQGVQPQTAVVSGWVPAGYYARLRTVQNTGTPTFSYRAGQEVLM